jgi:BolA family transcriptional regulator, general stress-responsive regulator
MTRAETLEKRLRAALDPVTLTIIDDSDKHIGHAGNNGGNHFTLHISSPQFENLSTIACHRRVYEAVGDLIPTAIHALSIKITN